MSRNKNPQIALALAIIATMLFVNTSPGLAVPLDNVAYDGTNDNFADALIVDTLPFSYLGDNSAASIEPGEPIPSCAQWSGSSNRTVWFSYSPLESHSMMIRLSNVFYYNFVAVYTGDTFADLSEKNCAYILYYNQITFYAEAGETYYFQLGSLYEWDYGNYTFELDFPPPPEVSFWFTPGDPSIFDMLWFGDSSYDPLYIGISDFWWDFGDGATAIGNYVNHQFAADGDYAVWHKVQTYDGRSAETTQVVQVRTHDVAITKFIVPESARVGRTKAITVGLRNTRYPETVLVELWKSTTSGFDYITSLEKTVRVRPSNRTTDFIFNYTFTEQDGIQGKVTFKAIAYIQGYRDPLPADNEAIALPTHVKR